MDIIGSITDKLAVKRWQVEAAVNLIDEGNTIPFIARYRKEATGTLDDEQLRLLGEQLTYLRGLEEKREQILRTIEEQGALTDELRSQIEAAVTMVELEDLYRPYRPKRKTRASVAKAKGLEPLALEILLQNAKSPLSDLAAKYVNPAPEGVTDKAELEKYVATVEEALAGAADILAEMISDDASYRAYIREETWSHGILISTAKDEKAQSVYEGYYNYQEPLKKVAGHRTLAINRGENEKLLSVSIEAPEEQILRFLEKKVITNPANPYTTLFLKDMLADSYKRLIAPAIERELRSKLTEDAQEGAITVFGKNLEQLLLQPPIAGKVVLGWDPAFRTGCKLAVVDVTGKVLDTKVIYPTAPQNKVAEAKRDLKALIDKYKIDLISVGNGTASRESEMIIVELLGELKKPVQYVIVNEAGASVYSASKLATEEFPNFDVGQRSAASIARRLQDPLSELVKIDPQSIGVGQYQHDCDQKRLSEALGGVVERSVNSVGVDLNTASVPLLSYVAGINKTLAKNIVAYREENGSFKSRKELLKVAKLGPKAYEQCAGFLRIRGGKEPLDATAVHPESYEVAHKLIALIGKASDNANDNAGAIADREGLKKARGNAAAYAKELGVGEPTLLDIIAELERPGRDPREDSPKPILRSDVLEMKDLKPGMILKGTVRNVIDFGAFVDIGVHQDGLVHISQICERFIKHPLEAVSVGDIVDVQVLAVDEAKKRISLTMKIKQENA